MKILKTTVILFGLALPLLSFGAGLQISPSHLSITVSAGQEMMQKLVVANPTADVQIFEITADNYPDNIIPLPKSFTLESGARKTVIIKILSQGLLSQTNQKVVTDLSVVAKPLTADELTVGTGAKIPVEITVIQEQYKDNNKTIAMFLTITLAFVLLLAFLKNKHKIHR